MRACIIIIAFQATLATLCCLCLADSSSSQSGLLSRSFSVRTKITSVDQELESTQILVHERYSKEQKRARLDFKFSLKSRNTDNDATKSSQIVTGDGAFYLDAQRNIVLLINDSASCRRWTVEALDKTLGLDAIKTDDYITQRYIVGPARLLLLVDRYRDKMRLDTKGIGMKIHNLDTIMYTLDLTEVVGGQQQKGLRLDIYYSQIALAADQQSLPLEIHILYAAESKINAVKSVVIVDFSQIEYLDEASAESREEVNLWSAQMVRAKQQVAYDPFIIDPGFGCSSVLNVEEDDPLTRKLKSATKFSFKAKVDLSGGESSMHCFVAYDEPLKTMRSERIDRDENESGLRRQIFSLDLNRMYHVLERSPGSANTIDLILDMSQIMKSNNQPENQAATDTSQCMIAKLWPRKATVESSQPSLAKMLAGADSFVYMGKARVRGIKALVYEAYSGVSPFWLEQPVVYYNSSTEETVREPDKGQLVGNTNMVLTVLLYVAESQQQPVLLIELYKLDKVNKFMLRSQRSLSIYDFTWELEPQTAEGNRMSELFSLGDSCSAGIGKNAYARIDLELESNEPLTEEVEEELKAVHQRDASVLASLQSHLLIPVPMIFDLETRYLRSADHVINLPANSNANRKQLIRVSFRLAEHAQDNVEVIYIGQGIPKPYASDRSVSLTRNFQACFFLASHLRFNIYFGYNPNSRMCFIMTTPINGPYPDNPQTERPPGFTKGEGDATELYRISHSAGLRGIEPNNFLRSLTNQNFRLALLNKKINLLAGGSSSIGFTIKRFEVDERDLKTSIASGEGVKNERQLDTSQFIGFSLDEAAEGSLSRRVVPAPLSAYTWNSNAKLTDESESSMTLDQCRAACLADVSCRSFSVCIRNSEVHCIVSKIDFRSVGVAEQLQPDVVAYYKSGSRIKVRLGDQTQVELIKQPNCELHNIVYLDLFQDPGPSFNTIASRYLYPVESVEQCAQLFVEHNLKVMREDIRQAANSLSTLALGPAHDLDSLQRQLNIHHSVGRHLQRNFFYLDSSRRSLDPKAVQSRVRKLKPLSDDLIDGYCVLSDSIEPEDHSTNTEPQSNSSLVNQYVKLDMYSFKYELFYERRFGVKLKGSPLEPDEQEAYDLVLAESDRATEEMFKQTKTKVELGENFLSTWRYDATNCAKTCYRQTLGPWPACRSFDIYFDEHGRIMCQLNSITLRQAIAMQRFDLIEDSSEQVSHYDPHSGFVLDEALLWSEVEMAKEGVFSDWARKIPARLHLLGSLLVVLIGLIGGLLLGLIIGRKLIQNLSTGVKNRERDELVGPRATVEFSNLVNEEGAIA